MSLLHSRKLRRAQLERRIKDLHIEIDHRKREILEVERDLKIVVSAIEAEENPKPAAKQAAGPEKPAPKAEEKR